MPCTRFPRKVGPTCTCIYWVQADMYVNGQIWCTCAISQLRQNGGNNKICHVDLLLQQGEYYQRGQQSKGSLQVAAKFTLHPFFHVLGSPLYLMPIYTCTKGNVYLLLSRKGPLHKISIRFCNSWNML